MEKDKNETMGAGGLLSQDVYCVCFPQRDSIETLHGELAAARQKFFSNGRKAVKVGRRETVLGFDGVLRGKLSRWGFYWKKTAMGVDGGRGIALEEAFDQKNGTVLVSRDLRGTIVSRSFFTKEHAWQKSEYYEPWDPGTAKVMFKPGQNGDDIERYDWDMEKRFYRSTLLHPAPYRPGTAEQALLNARFGEPQLILSAEGGLLCYCPQKEALAREQALADMKSGTMVLMPAWEIKDGAFLGDEGEEETNLTFTSLEEYARIDPPSLPVQAQGVSSPALSPAPVAARPDEAEVEYILAGVKEEAVLLEGETLTAEVSPTPNNAVLPAEEDSAVLPVVREAMAGAASCLPQEDASILFAAHQAKGAETELPSQEATSLDISRPASHGAGHPPKGRHPLPVRMSESSILSAARRQAAGQGDACQAKLAGIEEKAILSAARRAAGKTAPSAPLKPRHAGAQGPLSNKCTQQVGGLAAYEGEYKDGKRQGFGSSYYKSGDLSYAGFWQEDRKDGLGASFREGDHALHVSRWIQGKPGQTVALFDKEGSLRFGGRIIGGKKEGAGVSINSEDGSILVKKWSGGQDTGMASAFDPDGNLLYYGCWKDGKRHGHGTEFDKNGGIVFDGEWRDGQYFNGILYQKPPEPPLPAGLESSEPDWDL